MQAAAPSLHKEGLLGNDVLFNDEEINTLLTGRFGVSSVTGLDDIAWLTGQLNKLAELKCAALHKEGAGGDAELRKIVEWAKTKTPCASHYECLLADLMGLLAKRAATDAPKETGKP